MTPSCWQTRFYILRALIYKMNWVYLVHSLLQDAKGRQTRKRCGWARNRGMTLLSAPDRGQLGGGHGDWDGGEGELGSFASTRGLPGPGRGRDSGWGSHFTLPTYRGSVPVYSSTTKNWFHTQPRFTRPVPGAPSCAARGSDGAGVPAAHRGPGSCGGGGSSSSSSSSSNAGDSAAPARSPRPSSRGLMLGLPGPWAQEHGREAPGRGRSMAGRSGAVSHGGLSAAAGAPPPTGHPDRRAALNAAQPWGRPAAEGGGAVAPGAWTAPGVPARAPLARPQPDHQAAPLQLRSRGCAMVPALRGAGWGPADPSGTRGRPDQEPARETRKHQRRLSAERAGCVYLFVLRVLIKRRQCAWHGAGWDKQDQVVPAFLGSQSSSHVLSPPPSPGNFLSTPTSHILSLSPSPGTRFPHGPLLQLFLRGPP